MSKRQPWTRSQIHRGTGEGSSAEAGAVVNGVADVDAVLSDAEDCGCASDNSDDEAGDEVDDGSC